jgi:hypothetical protein
MLMFKLLITGSRKVVTDGTAGRLHTALDLVAYHMCPEGGLLLHGDAHGVDTYAKEYWDSLGPEYEVKGFPYPSKYGAAGGPIRNQQMVDFGADLCLGFPAAGSVGTYDCMNRAKEAGIPTFSIAKWSDLDLKFEPYVREHRKAGW